MQIEKEKTSTGIEVIESRMFPLRPYLSKITFSDGETWILVQPLYKNSSRGHRWKKAWVDASNVSISQLENIIIPTGEYKVEDKKYFNW